MQHQGTQFHNMFFQCKHDRIRTSIKGIGCSNDFISSSSSCPCIVGMDKTYNGSRYIIHVENGWIGIQTSRVQFIGILHGQFSKCRKILFQKGRAYFLHPFRYNLGRTILQPIAGTDRCHHSRCGGGSLLVGRDDQNEGPNLRPMRFGRNLFGHGIQSILPLSTTIPRHKATVHTPTGRSTSLTSHRGELSRKFFPCAHQFGQCRHQGSISSRTTGHTCCSRKCIVT
mmetsp:Transcript_8665/g.20039  ORF Transcript_8665/g.20039 Transcript_8665/m.20039 type:complete len:227 (+) Transcript_8665:481-1161(+)